jgi:hypothetical protein
MPFTFLPAGVTMTASFFALAILNWAILSTPCKDDESLVRCESLDSALEFVRSNFEKPDQPSELSMTLLKMWVSSQGEDSREAKTAFLKSIELVSGRVPAWWSSAVRDCRRVEVSGGNGALQVSSFPRRKSRPMIEKNTVFERAEKVMSTNSDGLLTFRIGESNAFLPPELRSQERNWHKMGPFGDFLSAVLFDDSVYFSLHSSYCAQPYKVMRVDPVDGHVNWSSNVWLLETEFNDTGAHFSELVADGNVVTVFGLSDNEAYAHSFFVNTGMPLFRFSSLLELAMTVDK